MGGPKGHWYEPTSRSLVWVDFKVICFNWDVTDL